MIAVMVTEYEAEIINKLRAVSDCDKCMALMRLGLPFTCRMINYTLNVVRMDKESTLKKQAENMKNYKQQGHTDEPIFGTGEVKILLQCAEDQGGEM